ncbi:MAG: hypothetical protein JRI23_22575 [Deltaproteobacteria bacterium]|jgi:hypothetical protein|nr:hypothetical protein [Deltaproteobacteria bacterium]MBW2534747.1 hypothetical protein [Deltaproteobacteria bacterium]
MSPSKHPYCLVLCKEGPYDSYGLYNVYFVNLSDAEVRAVRITSRGYCSGDDELIQTSEGVKHLGAIAAGGHAVVETTDEGAFDFAIGYSAAVDTADGTATMSFSVDKYLPAYTPPDAETPMGKPGWVIEAR